MSQAATALSPLLTQSTAIQASRGEGCYLYDDNGGRYLDFTSGIGVLSTGHCHPDVVAAIQRQAATLIHGQYAIVRHDSLMSLVERLDDITPAGIDSFFISNAGTEAVEAAIRLVRQATRKPNIIAFRGAFHGRTMGSLSLTSSNAKVRQGTQPMMGGAIVAPYPDPHWYGLDEEATAAFCLREFDQIVETYSTPSETAAVIIEPVQGESGYVPAPAAFLKGLRERCDAHGLVLIIDEVQCGNGRSGRFWAHEAAGITPDILITAKGIASGMPLSVMGASRSLMEQGWPGSQGGTYGGNAIACAAAVATLDVIEHENLVDNAAARGAQLRAGLERLQERYPEFDDVRGVGLMQAVHVVDDSGRPDGERVGRLLAAAEERGLLLLRCGSAGQVVRWVPPLIASEQQVDEALASFEAAWEAVRRDA
ncbi:aspartate aminotransferase family protein [Arhodomonas sp. AD133]|uniref:aspartate aminotransferase family protein n=1 Tax=Arhodomonas sp. AD133 TaxID=3415009 RepID=UPI003EBC3EF8